MQVTGRLKQFENLCRKMKKRASDEDLKRLSDFAAEVERDGDEPFLARILCKLAMLYSERDMEIDSCRHFFESGRKSIQLEMDMRRYEFPTTIENIGSAHECFSSTIDILVEKEIFIAASIIALEFADCLMVLKRYIESASFYGRAAVLFQSVRCTSLSFLAMEKKFACEVLVESFSEALSTIQRMIVLLRGGSSRLISFGRDRIPLALCTEALVLLRIGRIEEVFSIIQTLSEDSECESIAIPLGIVVSSILSRDEKEMILAEFHFQRYVIQSEALAMALNTAVEAYKSASK